MTDAWCSFELNADSCQQDVQILKKIFFPIYYFYSIKQNLYLFLIYSEMRNLDIEPNSLLIPVLLFICTKQLKFECKINISHLLFVYLLFVKLLATTRLVDSFKSPLSCSHLFYHSDWTAKQLNVLKLKYSGTFNNFPLNYLQFCNSLSFVCI